MDSVRTSQHTLYRAAKADPGRRFHALRDKVFRRDVLERAWVAVRRKQRAPGIDATTLADVEEYGIPRLLDELATELREGSYRPFPARRVHIPKPGTGERRPLSIPTVRDRIVQAATKIVLEPIFEADFAPCSFGFRPRRSLHDALQVVLDEAGRGRRWVVETDIADCFSTIPHEALMHAVEEHVSDRAVLKLLGTMLRGSDGGRHRARTGHRRSAAGTVRGMTDGLPPCGVLQEPSTGFADPADEAPWAMQLVARVERADPPDRTAVCAAVAVAVVTLLADDRCRPGGAWYPAVARWLDGRRKHCRRARGAAWVRVQHLPGVTVEVCGAQVRAFVPGSTAAIPRELGRLQLSGGELPDPAAAAVCDPEPGGAVVVSISPQPVLPVGKAAAAAGHAAQLAAARMPAERLAAWAAAGFAVRVEHPDAARWDRLRPAAPVAIVDAGFTAVAPGTCTALARWA